MGQRIVIMMASALWPFISVEEREEMEWMTLTAQSDAGEKNRNEESYRVMSCHVMSCHVM